MIQYKYKTILFLLLTILFSVFVISQEGGADVEVDVADVAADAQAQAEVEAEPEAPKGDVFEFQAEVSRLMDIIINSLYSNKDIFLRELISNASDALDKIRFLGLTDSDLIGEGDDAKLAIYIRADPEAKTLSIRDSGIGMSKEDLVENLGTVARSGTAKFFEAMQSGGGNTDNLIGQFGVGFYSAYLVADKVVVRSKKSSSESQYVWESNAEDTFQIYEDDNNDLGLHGTEITMHLMEGAEEYLNENRLRGIIARYSQFIQFPIYLFTETTVPKEVPIEFDDDEDVESEADTSENEIDITEEDDEAEPKAKTMTVDEVITEWVELNTAAPLWTRSKDDITKEEYMSFYSSVNKEDYNKPMTWTHFKAEGGVDFTALLYIPRQPAHDLYDKYYQRSSAVKLYVRRVLLADEFDQLLPRYLNFVRGVVDSDDLPINVSRETLQKDKILQVIGRRATRKILKLLEDMAMKEEMDEEEDEEEASDPEVEVEEEDEDVETDDEFTYSEFWSRFGRSIKLGVLEDTKNKAKLQNLLRFESSKSEGESISLESYVERMSDEQQYIYYISGDSIDAVKDSPMIEELVSRDLEVLYFVDPLDEYLLQNMQDYDGFTLMSVASEGLKFDTDEDEDEEFSDPESEEEEEEDVNSGLLEYFNDVLSELVEKVVISTRLRTSPAVVVTPKYGMSANMERIMRAQPLLKGQMAAKRVLEINPNHELIIALRDKVDNGEDTEVMRDSIELILDSALLSSGFAYDKPLELATKIQRSLAASFVERSEPSEDLKDEL